MSPIKFGTDGWRGVIADDFTFANVALVAQAAADYWSRAATDSTRKRIVVGFDRRFLSRRFAEEATEVFIGNGLQVALSKEPLPTPSLSHAVKSEKAIGGVMITASHNPAIFNGFKLKADYGGAAGPEMCRQVEQEVDRHSIEKTPLDQASKLVTRKDLTRKHFQSLRRFVDFDLIARSGLRFAHDALYGVGAGCFDRLLAETECRVTTLHAEHDPLFGGISPEPIEKHYTETARFLQRDPHDICLVTDGDADRIGGMDGRGGYLSANDLICLLLHHCVANRKGKGRVVKALTTTSMVDKMCRDFGFALTETGVGFKHICTEMLKGDVFFGAEESGGIAFRGHIPERDGILAGLMLLELLATENMSVRQLLDRLKRRYGPHYYDRIDTPFPVERRQSLMAYCRNHPPTKLLGSAVVEVKTFDGVKIIARDGSWLMVRGSGTEPIVRVYAESSSSDKTRRLLKMGTGLLKRVN